ncbi:hypothetical protein [Streptomyces sp. CB02460]|nr:hypothetical protein [Streptomyces sp. CB02460]
MTTPLPSDEQPEYGVPSSDLTARAQEGFAAFLARFEDNDPFEGETTR